MKILKLIFIFSMFSLVNCSADDTFSYNDYAFLEQTEWVTAFDLFEDGEVRFLRFEKNNALLQQEWWNGSFDIYSIIDQNSILRLGLDFEYKIKYRDNNKRLLLDCITDGNYFDVVDRIGEINSGNNILGKWADMNGTEFKFEYRELPNDDYVYLFYIKGVNALCLIDG
ncbi:MAG: hypothetical protein PF518_15550, partial [Spirochaetaceae bacterium]|nr:hypothetical protein [Spirochaetaceae bacterium]